MNLLHISLTIFLLVTGSQNDQLTYDRSNIAPVHDYAWLGKSVAHNGSLIQTNSTVEAQMSTFQLFQLFMLLATCSILIYTIYKVNRLMKKLDESQSGKMDLAHDSAIEVDKIQEEPNGDESKQTQIAMKARDLKWLEKFEDLIEDELSNTLLKPLDMAEQMGVCERQLQRKLKELTGTSPAEYLKQARLKKGHNYLESGNFQTISEVAYKVGYKCPDYFSKSFKKHFGIKPNDLLNTMVLV